MTPPWRYILHADLDAFYASVEQRDNPALKGRPVVVGGAPEARSVVAAASYEARKYGIRSAMSMRVALRRCPELVRVSPHFDRYREASRQIMGIFRNLTPLIEPLSLDEAYLDISSLVRPDELDETARGLKGRVLQETQLTITIGGGTSKTVAKIASQVAKPDGLLLVAPGEERSFLAPLAVDVLWGIGPRTAAHLRVRGIRTVGELVACDEEWLRQNLGRRGPELRQRAGGIDYRPVVLEHEVKSISAETTMAEDVEDEAILAEQLDRLVRRVARELQEAGLKGRTVRVKLRLADFTTFTRQATTRSPVDDASTISRIARRLLFNETRSGRKFRLVGVGVTNFPSAYQLSLLPPDSG